MPVLDLVEDAAAPRPRRSTAPRDTSGTGRPSSSELAERPQVSGQATASRRPDSRRKSCSDLPDRRLTQAPCAALCGSTTRAQAGGSASTRGPATRLPQSELGRRLVLRVDVLLLLVEVLGVLDLVGDVLVLDLRRARLVRGGRRDVVLGRVDPVRGTCRARGPEAGPSAARARCRDLRSTLVPRTAGSSSLLAVEARPSGVLGLRRRRRGRSCRQYLPLGLSCRSRSPALSRPSPILSPCLSTASPSFFFASSRNPTSVPSSSTYVLQRRTRRRFAKLATVSSAPSPSPSSRSWGRRPPGKSDLALDLAERLGGEVVNTDSMQVYRGMDIGTAKLPVAERRGITHHLLDVLDVTEPATVAEFQGWAREVIDDCRERGVSPVLVGGSALYTRAILDEFEFPGTDPDVRERLEDGARRGRARGALHARLAERDPAAAAQVLPSNGRRVVRALEVIEITGRPFTRVAARAALPLRRTPSRSASTSTARPWTAASSSASSRCGPTGSSTRCGRLAERGLREGRTANRALGYQQVLAFLDGELTEDEAKERTVTGTRRFARRQDSWFRKDPRITWVRVRRPGACRDRPSRRSGGLAELVELPGEVAHPDQRGEHTPAAAARMAPKASIQNTDAQPELVAEDAADEGCRSASCPRPGTGSRRSSGRASVAGTGAAGS